MRGGGHGKACRLVAKLADHGGFGCLDLGGGVGVDYMQANDVDFSAYGALVTRLFKGSGYALSFEPGRAIAAN
ncbi:MAG: diaminopimelate decarboxylase, partial [Pseudomonadota bacterium]|nr:diaminopimelate decarboxylase [Pseudomonadota bacterium]